MKKIYYLQTYLVKIGDVIEYNGIKALVTEELIELNPELFRVEEHIQPIYFKSLKGINPFTTGRVYKQVDSIGYPTTIKLIADDNKEWTVRNWQSVYINESSNCFELTTKEEWDKQELLDEAKRRYPVGTVYKHFNSEYTTNSPDTLTVSEMDHHFEGVISISIWVRSEEYNGIVYEDGEWAEVLPLKFTTEDGVDIYGDMKTFLIHPNDSFDICFYHSSWKGDAKEKGCKYFYHKENALAYIKKHKEKTLEDYENILFERGNSMISSSGVTYSSVYGWLKYNEPKLYYTKILQLIADDLNDGRYIHIRRNASYHLSNAGEVNIHYGGDEGCVYFKSKDLADKARVILGDKVKYLF